MIEHNKALSNHLFRRLRTKDTILTYSGSRSVRESLVHCWKKGKQFSVVCSESRPAGEGTLPPTPSPCPC
jgi:translation initiation factor 2B subunit (eIF-2B alpha/beta/delta family)